VRDWAVAAWRVAITVSTGRRRPGDRELDGDVLSAARLLRHGFAKWWQRPGEI
jgi:hypothetical protein